MNDSRVWQRFLSGRRLDLANPSPFDFEDTDIALGLSRVARWNGATRGDYAYSVAQHSLDVLAEVRRTTPPARLSVRLELATLLHDACEGLLGMDVITPLKPFLGARWRQLEDGVQRAVHQRYGLPFPLPAAMTRRIKKADRGLAATEAVQLVGLTPAEAADPATFGMPEPPLERSLTPWPAKRAEEEFLAELRRLAAFVR
ncbi:hydrolase [Zavarzinia compransoris]|uniref:Hydrolase n=1 Tax=Zavarzinia compransoris TaxID=1264899 RepID=A0A317E8Q8_9PROT|nr:hydrolase [Zavarzinia compransoris]PWR23507.1 hydrolase [Zavarzinia compransoris]TDP47718.1 metal dependent phosphohydrolase [Zavarzinia compransoris]